MHAMMSPHLKPNLQMIKDIKIVELTSNVQIQNQTYSSGYKQYFRVISLRLQSNKPAKGDMYKVARNKGKL